MSDIIPKTIMHFLVNASRDALHGELVTKLYREGKLMGGDTRDSSFRIVCIFARRGPGCTRNTSTGIS